MSAEVDAIYSRSNSGRDLGSGDVLNFRYLKCRDSAGSQKRSGAEAESG